MFLNSFFLNNAPGKDPEELCACDYTSWVDKFGAYHEGCIIHTPTPPGYRCYCYEAFISTCDGRGEKCKSEEQVGCDGCKEKECCIGNCDGYPHNETINDQSLSK